MRPCRRGQFTHREHLLRSGLDARKRDQAWVIALIVTGALTIGALVLVIIMLLRGQRCPAARSETEGEH